MTQATKPLWCLIYSLVLLLETPQNLSFPFSHSGPQLSECLNKFHNGYECFCRQTPLPEIWSSFLQGMPSHLAHPLPLLSFPLLIKHCLARNLWIQIERRSKQRGKRSERFCAMEIKVESNSEHHDESKDPLLRDTTETEEKTLIQKAISQTFQSTAHLANLLPTGSLLAFQLLSPIFTNQGDCDSVSWFMTAALVTLCGVSCFLLSFSDSFKDKKGNICYGFATFRGLWVIDGSANLPPDLAAKYRLQFVDFMHAFMSILVFVAVALFDNSVVSCLFPTPSDETQEILTKLPVGIGVICSMLFVVFPTQRHGIGFPLSAN